MHKYSRDKNFDDTARTKKQLNDFPDDRAKRYARPTATPYSASHKAKRYDATSDDGQGRNRTRQQARNTHRNTAEKAGRSFDPQRNQFSQSKREGDARTGRSHKPPTSGPRRPRER
ncbi:MAG: hypothetical protein EBT19_03215 [Methylocystaceae bacterium]|nr:hypothetical protein [Methylocystaceae bacterium]